MQSLVSMHYHLALATKRIWPKNNAKRQEERRRKKSAGNWRANQSSLVGVAAAVAAGKH